MTWQFSRPWSWLVHLTKLFENYPYGNLKIRDFLVTGRHSVIIEFISLHIGPLSFFQYKCTATYRWWRWWHHGRPWWAKGMARRWGWHATRVGHRPTVPLIIVHLLLISSPLLPIHALLCFHHPVGPLKNKVSDDFTI